MDGVVSGGKGEEIGESDKRGRRREKSEIFFFFCVESVLWYVVRHRSVFYLLQVTSYKLCYI